MVSIAGLWLPVHLPVSWYVFFLLFVEHTRIYFDKHAGILMSTERGSGDLETTLEMTFVFVFAISIFVVVLYISRDLKRFWGKKRIAALIAEYEVKLNPALWSFTHLLKYLNSKPPEDELNMLRVFCANMKKYPQLDWMRPRILVLAKNAPEMFEYCCDPNYENVRGTLGSYTSVNPLQPGLKFVCQGTVFSTT